MWIYLLRHGIAEEPKVGQADEDRALTKQGRERLDIMRQTNDGFVIAEKDLELRGPGEYLGTRQSGLPDFRIGNIVTDTDVLELARKEAFEVVEDEILLQQTMAKAERWTFFQRYMAKLELAKIS